MQSEQLDDIINRVETAYRTSYALTRDLDQLRIDLKSLQLDGGGSVNLDAYIEGVERALPHDIQDAAVTGALRTKIIVEYCERNNLSVPDAYNPLIANQHEGVRIAEVAPRPNGFTGDVNAYLAPKAHTDLPTALEDLLEASRNVKPAAGLIAPMLPGEILTQQLSPSVFKQGRGFVKPGFGGLKEYQEGVPTSDFDTMARWPNGFFRNGRQAIDQFYLKTSSFFVLITDLSNTDADASAKVFMRSQNSTEALGLNDLGIGERIMLSNELNTEFTKLEQ